MKHAKNMWFKFNPSGILLVGGLFFTSTVFAQSAETLNPNFPFWKTKGNTGITEPTTPVTYGTSNFISGENWIGTTDAKDFTIGTNSIERMRILKNTGYVGIGYASPATQLDIASVNGWDVVNTPGDFRIGGGNLYQLRIGVAQGGAGAGDAYINVRQGTQRLFVGGGTNHQLLTVHGSLNNVGIRTTGGLTPASALDVAGDLALREGTAITVGNGVNSLTLTGEFSHYRLTGATLAFSINAIANGNNGQLLTLINATGQVMTITNNNVVNGILTGGNSDMVSNGTGNSSVSMIYNATLSRWIVYSSSGMLTGDDWHITGNTGIGNTNFLGTINTADLKFRTNNTEKAVLNTSGVLAVGNSTMGVATVNVTGYDLLGTYSNGFGYMTTHSYANGTWSDYFVNTKARGTGAAPAVVQNGDFVGGLWGNAFDGATYDWMTNIVSQVDGVPAVGNMPGRLTFGTSPAGGNYPVERMRINNIGYVGINTTNPLYRLHVVDAGAGVTVTYSENTYTGNADGVGISGRAVNNPGYGFGGVLTGGYAGVYSIANPSTYTGNSYAAFIENSGGTAGTHYGTYSYAVGTGVLNCGGYFAASGAINNYGVIVPLGGGRSGFGTATPNLAHVQIQGLVGNTALYVSGSANSQGIGFVTDWPGIYFNSYWNGGVMQMASTGYAALINSEQAAGGITFSTTPTANTTQNVAVVGLLERMRITGAGLVGIGTNAPAFKLDVFDGSTGVTNLYRGRNNAATGTITQIGSIEYFQDQTATIDFTGGSNFSINLNAGAAYNLQLANNSAAKPTSNVWTVASDAKLKEDVNSFKDGLKILRGVKPIYFKYNGKAGMPKEYGIGVLAQELKEVAPYTVGTWEYLPGNTPIDETTASKIEEYLSVDNGALTYVTINAVKEVDDKLEKMKATYSSISDFGTQNMNTPELLVEFSPEFKASLQGNAVVSITPLTAGVTLYIEEQTSKGFRVRQNGTTQPLTFNWVAMARVNTGILNADIAYTEEERAQMLSKVKLRPAKINLQAELDEMAKRKAEQEQHDKEQAKKPTMVDMKSVQPDTPEPLPQDLRKPSVKTMVAPTEPLQEKALPFAPKSETPK
ncbi:MAG: tail fiber domain-containing protein [Chitinophagales bacterium]